MGCNPVTLLQWEKGRTAPGVRFWPAILAFLGYNLSPAVTVAVCQLDGGQAPQAEATAMPLRLAKQALP